MSKYHILKNADFHNHVDNDSIATNARTLTHNIQNFNKNANNHHLADFDSSTDTHSMNENHFKNHFFNNEYERGPLSLKKLESRVEKTSQNIYKDCNDSSSSTARDIFNNISTNNLTPFGIIYNDDDYTLEAPLLQQNCNNTNDGDRNLYKNKRLHGSECICMCQQKGFAFNLNNNSTQSARSKMLWAVVLCCIFMVVEFLGGYIAGSLAIMTDAAHLASDCISFIIGLVAIWFGCKPPDSEMSFGYKRFEVMGAIVSILGIWILTAALVLVAIQRIYSNDYDLDANTMMTISGIGILINIIMIFILHTSVLGLSLGSTGYSHGHSHRKIHNGHHSTSYAHSHKPTSTYRKRSNEADYVHAEFAAVSLLSTESDANANVGAEKDSADTCEVTSTSIEMSPSSIAPNKNLLQHQQNGNEKNLNLRAAMIHVIGDLIQSFAVFLAAVLIKIFPKAVFLDPLCTLLFSIIVIMTTINLFKESMHLILDSVPQGLSIDDIKMDLMNIEGVMSVHHLNVWNHTSNYSILMAHLVTDNLTDSNAVLMKATQLAGSAKYNIKHSTIQIERHWQ